MAARVGQITGNPQTWPKKRRKKPTIVTTSPSGKITATGPEAAKAAEKQRDANTRVARLLAPTSEQAPSLDTPASELLTKEIEDLLTPGPTAREVAGAGQRLGVKPQAKTSDPVSKLLSKLGSTASAAADQITQGAENASEEARAAVKAVATLPRQPAKEALGINTLGSPTVAQVVQAARKGKTQLNKRGKLTLPATRKAARNLARAKKQVANTRTLSGPLTPGQKRFAQIVARETGLSPRVIAAQALAEESGQAALKREAEGNHNWLNIGYFDSGPGALTRDPTWSTPESAAHATAQFFKGKRFGPSQGIRNILPAAKGQPDSAQLAAIANSGWATNSTYGPLLTSTHQQVSGGQPNPQALAALKKAARTAQSLGIPTQAPQKPAEQAAGPGRIPSVVYIGHIAEKRFGLHVGENPAFGGVDPVHTDGSYHYRADAKGRGEAIDVSGDPEAMLAFDRFVSQKWGQGVTELFYDPGISIKEGQVIGGIGGHGDHVHVAVAQPGEQIGGGIAPGGAGSVAGPGGAVFVGAGKTAAGAATSANRARTAAAGGAGVTLSPISSLLATSTPLPEAFSQFQLGEEGGLGQGEGNSIIESILRSGRV